MTPQITELQSLALGLAQGLTEFIPVSSSAHLNILHTLFGHGRELTYDVLVSLGTTGALIWYFRHDWKELLTNPAQKKLRNLVFLACVPAGVLGYLLDKSGIEDRPPVADAWFNAMLLIVAGLVLLWADKSSRKERAVEDVTASDSWIIGAAQALALFPGVSRSGATITAGLFRGMTRESAARFSFLMSLPITLAATGYKCLSIAKHGGWASVGATPLSLMVGIIASGVSGFWAIGFLLNFLKKRDVTPFVVWRVIIALVVFALIATHRIPLTNSAGSTP